MLLERPKRNGEPFTESEYMRLFATSKTLIFNPPRPGLAYPARERDEIREAVASKYKVMTAKYLIPPPSFSEMTSGNLVVDIEYPWADIGLYTPIKFIFNPQGRLASIEYSQRHINFIYNELGRLVQYSELTTSPEGEVREVWWYTYEDTSLSWYSRQVGLMRFSTNYRGSEFPQGQSYTFEESIQQIGFPRPQLVAT